MLWIKSLISSLLVAVLVLTLLGVRHWENGPQSGTSAAVAGIGILVATLAASCYALWQLWVVDGKAARE